jgi:uncharacterized membrane protein
VKKPSATTVVSLVLVALGFAIAIALYDRLPDLIPTHWNSAGRPSFTAKPIGPFVLPLTTAGVYLLLLVIPHISPRGYRVDGFLRVFAIVQLAIVAFLFFLTLVGLFSAAGLPLDVERSLHAGLGLLLVILGNFMGKLTKNFFIGIRTPWTLASDEVWLRTHRLGGKLFVLAGLALLLAALVGGSGGYTSLCIILVAVAIPAVYSYVIYRRVES